MSDEAKAIEEVSKLGQRSLETLEKGGGWLDGVLGDGFRELGGVFTDNMAAYRYRNRLRVLKKTQDAIEAAGLQGQVRQLSDRIAVPLLEAIADESDEALQDVWASYIRNSVDPSKPNPDRLLIDVIRRLEPADWPVLQMLFSAGDRELRPEDFGLSENGLSQVLDRLTALGLLDFDDDRSVYVVASMPVRMLTISCGGAKYFENRLLHSLRRATANPP
jgi:hypothetical protein